MADMLKLALFDMDGTLLDSQAGIKQAMRIAFTKEGLAYPGDAAVLGIVGLSLLEAFAILAPSASQQQHKQMTQHYIDHVTYVRQQAQTHASLFDGAADCLQALAQREDVLIGLATGAGRGGVIHFIEHNNLSECFATLQYADNHPSKPNPSMISTALAETGVAPENAVMIGDTSYDLEMARNAGIAGIGVAWGYHDTANLRAAGAVDIAEDFPALLKLLLHRWGAHAG